MFRYREDAYLYDKNSNHFKLLKFDVQQNFGELKNYLCGLSESEYKNLYKLFGPCSMNISTFPFYLEMLKKSLSFFYIFQIFSLIIWYYGGGYKYVTLIK